WGVKRWEGLCVRAFVCCVFFFSSRRRHTILVSDWSSDVCSSDLPQLGRERGGPERRLRQAVRRSGAAGGPGDSEQVGRRGVAQQIGRASWRGRGEKGGGGGALRKKEGTRKEEVDEGRARQAERGA